MAKFDLVIAAGLAALYCVVYWNDWLSVSQTKSMSAELSLRVILKTLPLVWLMRVGFKHAWTLQGLKEARYGRGILLGLFASMFGDVLVELSWVRGHFYLVGLVAFLFAHVSYAYAFLLRHTDSIRNTWMTRLLRGVPWLLYVGSAYYFLAGPLKISASFQYGTAGLAVALFVLGWSASIRINRPDSTPSSQWFGFAGAVLLSIADLTQAFTKFHSHTNSASVFVMIVYYLAQACFTESIEGGLVFNRQALRRR